MSSPKALGDLRKSIDSVDDRILTLLAERAELVDEVAITKRAQAEGAKRFHDPERETRVIERLYAQGAGRFPRDAIRVVFREVMSACLSLEETQRVSFLGPEGTFSQMAAHKLFGLAARYQEATTIEGVFDAVRSKAAACGVVPVENSTEGSVTHTSDALLESDLRIRQELVLEVSHCLLTRATALGTITRVYSHPQALAQCREWLAKNLPGAQIIQTTSTAAATREAITDDCAGAIGSSLAGEIHGVPVLRDKIQDRPENATRFVVISADDAPRTGADKTSLAFSVKDQKGALRICLSVLEDAGVNLSRIESRPSRQKAWDYVFLADLEGHREDDAVKGAIVDLGAHCQMVKVFGSYPRYATPAR